MKLGRRVAVLEAMLSQLLMDKYGTYKNAQLNAKPAERLFMNVVMGRRLADEGKHLDAARWNGAEVTAMGASDTPQGHPASPIRLEPLKPKQPDTLDKATIMDAILLAGSAYFQSSQIAESEEFTLFAESVTDNLLPKLESWKNTQVVEALTAVGEGMDVTLADTWLAERDSIPWHMQTEQGRQGAIRESKRYFNAVTRAITKEKEKYKA